MMTDKDQKEMIASAKKIQEICWKSDCNGCPFDLGSSCKLNNSLPDNWNLENAEVVEEGGENE